MTDKEKLVEMLKNNREHYLATYSNHLKSYEEYTADHLLANGVTFVTDNNAGGKWISVKEALPEQDTLNFSVDVLICTNDGYVGVGCMCKYSHRESGWTWAGEDGVAVEGAVTHWMPLPEPPPMKQTSLEKLSDLCVELGLKKASPKGE